MENSIFIVLAKIDHILYKSRAYNSLISLKKVLKAVSSHECNLGKWYDHEGKERFSNTSAYPQIAQPHNIVHENANKILHSLIKQTRKKRYWNMLRIFYTTSKIWKKHQKNSLYFLTLC
ncbi:CZB domain-containing protein [Sulfurimonas sp. NW9]